MSSDPRLQRDPNRSVPSNSQSQTQTSSVCSMADFFKDYTQTVVTLTGTAIALFVIASVLMLVTPYYLNWTAGKSIQRNELLGMAELARKAQEAQIVVENAQAEVIAMGVIARGQKSAATSKADAIRIVGEAARRYPEYAQDEYLISLSSAISSDGVSSLNIEK